MPMKQKSPSTRRTFLDGVRIFNKFIFNRIVLLFAESGRGPFSVVYHTGRRSGRPYRTPVLATYINGAVIIPLSYGEHVDWLRNVLAQGGCEIVRKGKKIPATNPEVIDSTSAFTLLPEDRRKLFNRFELEKFLRLDVVVSG